MDDSTKTAIIDYVRRLDPNGEVVKLRHDPAGNGRIDFSPATTQHRVETVLTAEKYVEAYLCVKLVKELGYGVGRLELQTQYEAGHPKKDRPRLDVLLREVGKEGGEGPGRAFLMAEAKAPDEFEDQRDGAIEHQLYDLSDHEAARGGVGYLVYFTVEWRGNRLAERADIVDHWKYPTFRKWDDAGRPTLDILPTDYGRPKKAVYVAVDGDHPPGEGELALDDSAGPAVFDALRRDLHNVLWGGGGMSDNDVFVNLVKLFLVKTHDEETTDPEAGERNFRFQVGSKDGAPEPADELFERIDGLFRDSQRELLGLNEEQMKRTGGIDGSKMSPAKVAYVVERLQGYSLTKNRHPDNGDVLGAFFEGIVGRGFKQSRGQFFTHRNVVRFMIHGLGLPEKAASLSSGEENTAKPRLPTVCDPSCGSGTFLLEAMRAVEEAVRSGGGGGGKRVREFRAKRFGTPGDSEWASDYLYGAEINADLALATKVNMILHGDGHINIFAADGLGPFDDYGCPVKGKKSRMEGGSVPGGTPYSKEVNGEFDFVLTNPPFSIKADDARKRDYKKRFEFGGSPQSETLFMERWYQLLRAGGRVAAVLPESLFDTNSKRKARLFLYRHFRVDAVVSLPYGTFKPYTATKTAVLFATKKSDEEVAEYARRWAEEESHHKKALGRAKKYAGFEGGKVRETQPGARAVSAISKDPAGQREALAEMIGAPAPDAEALVERLRKTDKDDLKAVDLEHRVFRNVVASDDRPIFFATAEAIGYKRRAVGGDLQRSNNLFTLDDRGGVAPDSGDTILARLRAGEAPGDITGFVSTLPDIAGRWNLRCDPKYRWFWDHLGGRIVPGSRLDQVRMSKFVRPTEAGRVFKGRLEEERRLMDLKQVEPRTGHVIKSVGVSEIGSDKIEFAGADLLFGRLEPHLRKVVRVTERMGKENWIGTPEWIPLNVEADAADAHFIHALLLSEAAGAAYEMLRSGKRHARIDVDDFLDILVPDVPKEAQAAAAAELAPP